MPAPLSATEYRLLVEHSPVMIWRSGTDARCDYFNDTWLAFTGRTLEQEFGDGWAEGVHADDLRRCVDFYLDHFHRRAPFEMEYRLRRHDGAYRWIFDRGVPYRDERGEFAGFIGSCIDVDERRRAQDVDHAQLEAARQFERWVLAIVSHDLRNPLSAIEGSAALLAARASSDQAAREVAARIGRSAERIRNIVNDLLDVSRERHLGGLPLVLGPADLEAVCREVAEEFMVSAPGREICVERAGPATGTWDASRVSQAISNVVGNAVEHGSPTTPVLVRVGGDAGSATVEVHNAGEIAPEVMTTLFEPFAARRQGVHGAKGLGLGLFIARTIARAHQGELQVTSGGEHGTTFRLVLPRAPAG